MKQIISTISKYKYQINKIDTSVDKKIQHLIKTNIFINLAQQSKQKKTLDDNSINEAIRQGILVYSDEKAGFLIDNVPNYLLLKLMEVYAQGNINYRTNVFYINKSDLLSIHQQSIYKRINQTNILQESIFASALSLTKSFQTQDITKYFEREANMLANLTQKSITQTTNEPFDIEAFKQNYLKSIETKIKGLSDEQVLNIRTRIMKNVELAKRNNGISQLLQEQYGIAKKKADLIARQESQNIIIKYEEEKFNSIGIYKFKWRHPFPDRPTSRSHHVEWHKQSLAGKIFDSRNPPKNPKTGEPEMPGSEPNCHCVAIWIQE